MSPTNGELSEALKPSIGEEAARMIAEVVPPTRDLATKGDVDSVRLEIASVRGEMREGFALVRADMNAERANLLKWMIAMFVPVWLGSWGTVVAVLLKN